jgi:hypothetical protein
VQKILALIMLAIAVQCAALAVGPPAPEIDPASGASALALLAGAVLVIRGRKK